MPIHHCDFVVVNIYPNPPTLTLKGLEYYFNIFVISLVNSILSNYLEHPRLELSPLLSCELISVCASRWLASRLVR